MKETRLTADNNNSTILVFTLILSTLASSLSCSTSRRMLDKLELEVMIPEMTADEKILYKDKTKEKISPHAPDTSSLTSLMANKCWTRKEWPGFFPNDLCSLLRKQGERETHWPLCAFHQHCMENCLRSESTEKSGTLLCRRA